MNTKLPNSTPRLTTTPKLLSEPGGSSLRFSLIFICCLIFASISTNAQLAQWDPNGLGLGSDGSGGWEDGTNWLSAGVDGGWPGPSGNAVVGFGTPGSYLIVLSQNESVNTMTNKTSGYTFTGGDIFLQSGLSATSPALYVSNGVTVTFSNIVHLPGGAGGNIVLAPNSTANFAQAIVNGGGNPRLGGQGGTGVYNLTNGFSEGGTLDL